jgi:Ca-activated chloride channel family protein
MVQYRDLYKIIGVESTADPEQIKAAYRSAARRFHPDVNKHEGAMLHFRDVAEAYQTIGDEEARANYDINRRKQAQNSVRGFSIFNEGSKRVLPVISEPHVLYVLLQIVPNIKTEEHRRSPMNLALILDHSSSMHGERMGHVKIAARRTIEQLSPEDRISIVTFSDRADVLVKNRHVTDPRDVIATINTITPGGGTEIFQGLSAALNEVKRHFDRHYANHLILITDGRTYGDEEQALELADEAKRLGIGISAMGIGDERNDEFLDELAARTGGSSAFIPKASAVEEFMDERVRSLSEAYAERVQLTIAPDPDVQIESVFRIVPNAQPLKHEDQPINLGELQGKRSVMILMQFQMPGNLSPGRRGVARLDVTGDVMSDHGRQEFKAIGDVFVNVMQSPPPEDPPRVVMNALGKLTLYRMQQRAEDAVNAGDVDAATHRLQNLATRLLEAGQQELAAVAKDEARRISKTRAFSNDGVRKTLKFGTRALMLPAPEENDD